MSAVEVERLARAVLAEGRFDEQLAAVIRYAGWEARTLTHLEELGELDDVAVVLGRISAGSHYPHLRTDGTFEIRRAVGTAANQVKRNVKPAAKHTSRARRIGRAG